MKKRIINSLLSFVMVLSMVTSNVTAFAVHAEDIEGTEEPVTEVEPELIEETTEEEEETPAEEEPEVIEDNDEEPETPAEPEVTPEPEETPEPTEEPEITEEPVEEEYELLGDGEEVILSIFANGGTYNTASTLVDGDKLTYVCTVGDQVKVSGILNPFSPAREGYRLIGMDPDMYAKTPKYNLEETYSSFEETLYLIWEKAAYTVTLDPNQGAFPNMDPGATQEFVHETNTDQAVPYTPVRDGYRLEGWAIEEDGAAEFKDGVKYKEFSAEKDDITLYAVWTPVEYKVTLKPNGGLLAEETEVKDSVVKNYSVETAIDLTEAGILKKGYTFKGWFSDSKLTKQVASFDELLAAKGSIKTLYAKWEAKTYTVTLHSPIYPFANGEKEFSFEHTFGTPAAISAKNKGPVIPSEDDEIMGCKPNKAFRFTGWTTDDSPVATEPEFSHTKKYTYFTKDGEDIEDGGVVHLYACISKAEYTVTLHPNGGILEGDSEAQKTAVKTYDYKTGFDLIAGPAAKPGYNFEGWYSDAKFKKPVTSTKELINAGGSIKNLYAKWTGKPYTIKLHSTFMEPGSGEKEWTEEIKAVYGQPLSLSSKVKIPKLIKTKDPETGISMDWNAILKFSGWVSNDVLIPFDITPEYLHSKTYTSFVEPDEDGNIPENVDLRAAYTTREYPLTIHPNGGTYNGDTKKTVKKKYALMFREGLDVFDEDVISRKGYIFDGWYSDAKFKNRVNSNLDLFIAQGKIRHLYAKWTAKNYTITLNANGGSFINGLEVLPNLYHTVGKKIALNKMTGLKTTAPVTVPLGYKFLGWSDDEEAETVKYKNTTKYAKYSDDGEAVTLYAVWKPVQYSVTLYPNGGLVSGQKKTAKSVKKSYNVENLSEFFGEGYITRPGYTFAGWYKDAKFTTPVDEETLRLSQGTYKTLYAKWEAKTYTVTLHADALFPLGDEGVTEYSFEHTFGEAKTLSSELPAPEVTEEIDEEDPFPMRNAITFTGWSVSEEALSKVDIKPDFTHAASYKYFEGNGDNIDLYACAGLISYKVTLKPNGGILAGAKKKVTSVIKKYDASEEGKLDLTETGITRSGYVFDGWYSDAKFTEESRIDNTDQLIAAGGSIKTLYAKWVKA